MNKLFMNESEAILPRGKAQATLGKSINAKKGRTKDEPNIVKLSFNIGGKSIMRSYPRKLIDGSPLRVVLEVLNDGPFTQEQLKSGIDLDAFEGSVVEVFVDHARGAGGKKVAVIGTVEKLVAKPSPAGKLHIIDTSASDVVIDKKEVIEAVKA